MSEFQTRKAYTTDLADEQWAIVERIVNSQTLPRLLVIFGDDKYRNNSLDG